jgi:hypothetical protein
MGYIEGGTAHFHNEFRDPHTDELVDPSVVRFKYETPSGIETTLTYGVDPALTKTSTGKYLATVTLSSDGTWGFRWETAGTFAGVDEFTRDVAASQFS